MVRALAGAVREGRLAHAFLFSGPRGTGKTSTARILAKMVNCERGPTAEPCGACEQCVLIRNGTHLDVVEIDAASHGGVDDARELRERAPTAPAQGRRKVYIIDEAQRLSREAFDALLKLFEEPPDGVHFVLATTEPHKMPATIVGRTQRFEFRRIPAETIAEHLRKVAVDESITLADAAGEAIARQSEGSVRDALSLLDQAAVLGGGEVTEDTVASLVGTPEVDVQFALADAVAVGDARGVFAVVQQLVEQGHDLRHFTTRVTNHFRNLLLALASPEDPAIVDVAAEQHPRLAAQAQKFSMAELDRILGLLLQAQTDLRWSTAPRLTLELALVRAALPETDPQPAALQSRIERLERLAGLEPKEGGRAAAPSDRPPPRDATTVDTVVQEESARAGSDPTPAGPPAAPSDRSPEGAAGAPPPDQVADAPHAPAAGSVDAQLLRRSWPQVVEALKSRRMMVLYANAQIATVSEFDGETLELVFPPGRDFGARKVEQKQGELREVLGELFGISPAVRCLVREGAVALEPEPDEPPPTAEAAEALLREQFGAEPVDEE